MHTLNPYQGVRCGGRPESQIVIRAAKDVIYAAQAVVPQIGSKQITRRNTTRKGRAYPS
jgi:hypothetical protein